MAAAMNHTMQTCQHLAIMTQTQMIDEDKVDPFPARTTAELETMLAACRRTKEILSRESLIYSKIADFSKYSDTELHAFTAFARESTRMLSIILAGGSQHFWSGQVISTLQELKNMYDYIDEKVKDFLMLDTIMSTLDYKVRYGRKMSATKADRVSAHPELNAFTAIDASKGATSQDSLVRLAEVCEKVSLQCRAIAQTRIERMEDRSKKVEVRAKLLVEIDSVLPMLRQHVLRIGLHKCQLQDNHPSGKTHGTGPGTHAHKITSLFSHKAVEEAHRTVEDCRERLMQEQLFRRAKVERRLQQEEELERSGTGKHGYQLTDLPAYSGVLNSGHQDHRKGGKQRSGHHSNSPGRHGETSDSPGRGKHGATDGKLAPPKAHKDRTSHSPSPSPRGGSHHSPKAPSPRSASPPKKDSPEPRRSQRPAAEPKGGTKNVRKPAAKGPPSRESSPKSSSPKARSRQR